MAFTRTIGPFAAAAILLTGCVTPAAQNEQSAVDTMASDEQQSFEQDRAAILAMAGDYRVTFDFTETVAFIEGYKLKDRYTTGGYESVRVIEDTGDFISLQHILVVGGEEGFPIKHWRQDWRYEPASVLTFVGGNAWRQKAVSAADRKGKWSQVVYQVDDAPRYGALAAWSHENGASAWTPPAEWRPLPRRDATKRDDYHAIKAVNRHAITPDGWVHEQDNSKLILSGEPQILAREIGVNSYLHSNEYDASIADAYWAKTSDYWAGVRQKWTTLETANTEFGLTIQGEPEELYMKLLKIADAVSKGEEQTDAAVKSAVAIIDDYTTTEIGALSARLASNDNAKKAY